MKKAIVLLLALAVLGGAVFAQDAAPALKFSGYVATGINYNISADDLSMIGYYNGYSDRVRLNADYMNGNFGVHFRYQAIAGSDANITQALVIGSFFDKMLTINLGKLNDYSMSTYDYYGNTDGREGFELFLAPVSGLKLAAFVPVTQTGGVAIATAFDGAMFAAKYSAEGIGDFYAGYGSKGFTKGGSPSAYTNVASAWAEAEITAVKNLDAIVEMYIADLTNSPDEPYFTVDISYAMDALTLGFYNEDGIASTLYWKADPYVSYAVTDMVTLGGDVSYDSDAVLTAQGYIKYMPTAMATIRVAGGYDGTDAYVGADLLFSF